jgi:DNA polymerase III subunit epsilon
MFNEPVVFVDIETTGGSYRSSRILEFAAIRVEDGEIVDEFKTLINPGVSIPNFITNITGISDSDIANAPYFEDIAEDITRILQDAVFVAHNVRFDYSFVKNQLEACGHKFRPKMLCTVRLSRALYPQEKGHSLEKLLARHSIQTANRHRAYDDALAIYTFCKIAFEEHGQEAFLAAQKLQLKTQTLPPNVSEDNIAELTNSAGVYIFEDDAGTPLYIGKSVNIRKRVLSHFSADTKESKEMKLSQTVHHIRTIETGSELEALLLESQMIKQQLPMYNRLLRRTRKQYILFKDMDENGYITVRTGEQNISDVTDLTSIFGVYSSRRAAKAELENHIRAYLLCPKLLGLEKSIGSCFHYQLKRCKGACAGKETAATYNMRAEMAFKHSRVIDWPYADAAVIRPSAEMNEGLIIYKWCVIGKTTDIVEGGSIDFSTQMFDMDAYKILRGYYQKYRELFTPLSLNITELAV